MLPMERLVTFTGACANEIIPNGQHVRLLAKRKKEVMLEFYFLNIKTREVLYNSFFNLLFHGSVLTEMW
jgi:hypothetical protein